MKTAVINFSGNVGKSTIARHLLLPRIDGAELICVESVNDQSGTRSSVRGKEFGALQEYLQTVPSAVVDIGASNVEDLLALMDKYQGSHEDFDCFVVPTVAALKQQRDTIATLVELAWLGVPASRVRVVFNMVENGVDVTSAFSPLLRFIEEQAMAQVSTRCRLGVNEVYGRLKTLAQEDSGALHRLALDDTDYKSLIANATGSAEKLSWAHKLATCRLARGVVPELDDCFNALELA